MTALLAVDAGGSKTDVVLCDPAGGVLARRRTGGFVPHLVGAEEAVGRLAPAVEEVLDDAGSPPVALFSGCLANVDLPVEERAVRAALEARGWADRLTVLNDTYALLRCGAGEGQGVAVVCGTGINALGLHRDGRTARFAALGRLTGDWGGGAGLAAAVMWWSVRSEDGRGPATALPALVAEHFGRRTATEVAEAVHLQDLPSERLLELVPLLLAAADDGDEVALRLVRRQAEEVALLAVTALRRLDLLGTPVPVVLGGGILASGNAVLLDGVRDGLLADAPLAELRLVTAPPVLGAALLALDEQVARGALAPDAAEDAEERLREVLVSGLATAQRTYSGGTG